jgi:RecA-family ATPase
MHNGTGDAGSVHWSNSARSRLYLSRVLTPDGDYKNTEDDPNARVLSRKKSNYTATGEEIKIRWEEGVFTHEHVEREEPGDPLSAAHKAERVFLHLLCWHELKGIAVSPNRSATYTPSLFARHPQSEGVSKLRFERAMAVLLEQDRVEVVEFGPPSRRRSKLVSGGMNS